MQMLEHAEKNPCKPKTVEDWICKASNSQPNCATLTLDSLVNQNIFDKESTLFGLKYPTVNSGKREGVLGLV